MQALQSRVPHSAGEKPAGRVEHEVTEVLQHGVARVCARGTRTGEKRLEVGSSRLEPPVCRTESSCNPRLNSWSGW